MRGTRITLMPLLLVGAVLNGCSDRNRPHQPTVEAFGSPAAERRANESAMQILLSGRQNPSFK